MNCHKVLFLEVRDRHERTETVTVHFRVQQTTCVVIFYFMAGIVDVTMLKHWIFCLPLKSDEFCSVRCLIPSQISRN
jgi:hypothetical protein